MTATLSREITQPWLIQRAQIQTPLADPKEATLTKSLDLDYMGSAEFEFGALPASLRRIRSAHYHATRLVRCITQDESPLRVFSCFNEEDFAKYTEFLKELRFGNPQLKEVSRFGANYPQGEYSRTDFWWDIDNDVIWSFNKNYMNRLPQYLKNSFEVMS